LQGHPTTHDGLPGIRIASGSLGQGMSVGIGAAQAKKLNNDDHLVYTFMVTVSCKKVKTGKRCMLLLKVDNLIATIDLNGKQIDGATDEVLPMGSIRAKFEAFDWDVLDIKEGNNIKHYSWNDGSKIQNRKRKTSLCIAY
jgi:transketolase